MKTCIDLNCDMGEGFGPWRIGDGVDEQLMPLISSANVATGFPTCRQALPRLRSRIGTVRAPIPSQC